MQYQTQINATDPAKWQNVEAETLEDAAVAALRQINPPAGFYPCEVYVADPKVMTWPNGAPLRVHAFTFVLNLELPERANTPDRN